MLVKMKIKRAYQAFTWRWKIENDLCGICQQGFDQMCTSCIHPIECKPCIGKCTHSFHTHCITRWLSTNKACPMCRSVWKYNKIYE